MISSFSEFCLLESEDIDVGMNNSVDNLLKSILRSLRLKNDPGSGSKPSMRSVEFFKEVDFDLLNRSGYGMWAEENVLIGGNRVTFLILPRTQPFRRIERVSDMKIKNLECGLVIVSDKPFDSSIVLDKTFISSYKGVSSRVSFSVIDDFSEKSVRVTRKDSKWNSAKGNWDYTEKKVETYYTTYALNVTDGESEDISLEEIEKLPAFQDLLSSLPVKVARRTKQGFIFAVPIDNIIPPERTEFPASAEYYYYGYAIVDTGYIRNYPMYGGSPPSVASKFNSSSKDGWEAGLKDIKSRFLKRFKDLEKDGGKVLFTDEDKHRHRGTIKGRKLGI